MDVRLVHQQIGYIFQISKFSLISFIYEVASKVFKIDINSLELYYQEKLVPNSDTNALQYFKNFPILIQVKDLTKAGSTIKTDKKRSRKKHYVKCQICRQKKSIFYCRQCNQFICFECNVRFPEHYEHQKINLESGDLLLCFEEYRSIIIKQLDILFNSYKLSKENIIDILERRDIFEKLIQTLKELDKKTGQLTALETSFKCTDQLFKMYSNNLREIEPPKFIEDTEGSFSIINEREHEMRDFIPFINLQIIKSKFNEKMFTFIKTTQKLFNDIMNEINFRLNESTKLYDMTYDDIVQYNTQRMNEDKDSDSDSDISKQLKESISKNNKNKNDESNSNSNNNSNSNSNSNNSNKNRNANDDKKNSNNNNEANSKNSTDSKNGSKTKTSINDNAGDSKKNIPSIFSSAKKSKEKEEIKEIKANKKLFPFILGDSNKKSINKQNLLNKIKENALNLDKNLNESSHNRLLLKTLLDKKLKKNKSIESFPLINKFKKNENNSDFNIKSFNDNKNEKNNELILSHGNLNNLSKSKSQLKIKIFDTFNTKINNIRDSTKTKTDNFKSSTKIKQIRIKDNKNSFSN